MNLLCFSDRKGLANVSDFRAFQKYFFPNMFSEQPTLITILGCPTIHWFIRLPHHTFCIWRNYFANYFDFNCFFLYIQTVWGAT